MQIRVLIVGIVIAAACSRQDPQEPRALTVATSLDTLVTTESGSIGFAADMDAAPDGVIYVADWQVNQILVIAPEGPDTTRIGGPGEGPGEFNAPWALRASSDGVMVVDRGNGRIQRLARSGAFESSAPVTPMVMQGMPSLRRDGGLVVSTNGRDSSLAVVFDSASVELRRVGTPVAVPPSVRDFQAIKARINQGEIPPELRNEALVASHGARGITVALQTEGEVRRYGPDGALRWTRSVEEPEMAATLETFFRQNAEDPDPSRFYSLRYFRDLAVVEGEAWVLLDTQPSSAAVVLALPDDGSSPRRIEVPGAGGAVTMAVDAARGRLFLFTAHDAQLLMATTP